jgi:lactoylglutathione lyase
MFSHVFIGIRDFQRAHRFYKALMDVLGNEPRFFDATKGWAGWYSAGRTRPLLVIGKPYDGQPHAVGNGQMAALAAANRAQVHALYEAALAHGGVCEGPPGLRPQYHPDYYGAYFRDTEGNKLCVVCHQPE